MRQAVGGTDDILAMHATRIVGIASPTRDDLCTLDPDDIPPVGQPS